MEQLGNLSDLLGIVQAAARECEVRRLALVGGAVRDGLLHHLHCDSWRGLSDLDLVVEGSAEALAEAIQKRCGADRVSELRVHGNYGTVELVLDGVSLDLAMARQEHYPYPGLNPVVEPGDLELDLARRDFTVNALALDLPLQASGAGRLESLPVLDRHGGQEHLARRQLAFLHDHSVADDPTRVLRAARYGARLGFSLTPDALRQILLTLEEWPWAWRIGDPPEQAPPALATRMRMELELLFAREPWREALQRLQCWGGLKLFDAALQDDPHLCRRLGQAHRLGLPMLTSLVAGAADPASLGARLHLPSKQQRLLQSLPGLLHWLKAEVRPVASSWKAAEWSEALEGRAASSELVAHAVCVLANDSVAADVWKPLLRWWGRWQYVQAPVTARELLAQGWSAGPELGAELQRQRRQLLADL